MHAVSTGFVIMDGCERVVKNSNVTVKMVYRDIVVTLLFLPAEDMESKLDHVRGTCCANGKDITKTICNGEEAFYPRDIMSLMDIKESIDRAYRQGKITVF